MSSESAAKIVKGEGAAPKGDPEGGPITVESLFALYKKQRLQDRESSGRDEERMDKLFDMQQNMRKEWTAGLQYQREMRQDSLDGIQSLQERVESEWVTQKIRIG